MVNSLTFFSKLTIEIPDKRGKKFLFRISGTVRGSQIADYLGAKLNPKSGWEKDICIHLKPANLKCVRDGDYVDILDSKPEAALKLKDRPKIKVIAMNTPHRDWLKTFLPNEVVIIPHYHLNFERIKRARKEVTTCGYIGTNSPFHIEVNKKVRVKLERAGFKFIGLFNFTNREEIVEFYKSIDIQVIGYFDFIKDCPYYHEKKILDAMSFGIPTIAGEKLGYRDINDYYIHANNLDELIAEAIKLKGGWDAERLIKKAEEYHIKNIATKYENLS
jgi:hypothetical protein